MTYYIDYPGYPLSSEVAVSPRDRLIPDRDDAVATARVLYQQYRQVPKVVVCEFPSGRRVATIGGRRSNPNVIYRQ